jgi:ABC-type polysaccharide/polyol phosphate export permease
MCARYRRALAGFFWVIANPILTFVIQSLVFKSILKVEIYNYPTFLLAGLMPWFFISQSLYVVTNCLVNSREVLLGFKIHPIIIVSSQVLDQFVSFLAAFLLTALILLKYDFSNLIFLKLGMVFVSTFILCIFVLLITNLVAFWHVFYRDVQFIVQFIMNLAFYLTPIFYPRDILPQKYQWIISLNIFYPFIKMYQDSMYSLNVSSWTANLYICLMTIGSLVLLIHLSYKIKMKDFYINV